MKTVWILKGLPASGKSTWAKEKVAKSNCGIKRVNKDDLRSMLDSGRHSKGNEKFILLLRDLVIRGALADGKHIIVDDTNFHPKHEEAIREIAKDYSAIVKVKFFEVKPEEAIERDLKRPNSVGAKVIWEMYNTYLKPEKDKENKPETLKQNPELPYAIICDLDGTLAMHNGREPYEYDKCDTDLVNKPVLSILSRVQSEKCKIIFLSGREDSCKDKTKLWLENTGFLTDLLGVDSIDSREHCELFMRKTKDFRKDTIIKKEIFDREIKDKYYIDFVLDDRDCVVEMWRDLGLTCLQVANGNF